MTHDYTKSHTIAHNAYLSISELFFQNFFDFVCIVRHNKPFLAFFNWNAQKFSKISNTILPNLACLLLILHDSASLMTNNVERCDERWWNEWMNLKCFAAKMTDILNTAPSQLECQISNLVHTVKYRQIRIGLRLNAIECNLFAQ